MSNRLFRKTCLLFLAFCLVFSTYSFAFAGGDDSEGEEEIKTNDILIAECMYENFHRVTQDSDLDEYNKIYAFVEQYIVNNDESKLQEAKREYDNYCYKMDNYDFFCDTILEWFNIKEGDEHFDELMNIFLDRSIETINDKINKANDYYINNIVKHEPIVLPPAPIDDPFLDPTKQHQVKPTIPLENPDTQVHPSTSQPVEEPQEQNPEEIQTFSTVEKNGETWFELNEDTTVEQLAQIGNYDLKNHTLTVNNIDPTTFFDLTIKNGKIVYTGSNPLFQTNGGNLSLSDVEIQANGSGQLLKFAAAGALAGSVSMENVNATYNEQNYCKQRGALMYFAGTDAINLSVNLNNSVFKNFSSKYVGGAVYVEAENLTINASNCTFDNCHSQNSGGCFYLFADKCTLNLPGTLIKNCFTADGNNDGGAIFVNGNNCIITGANGTLIEGCHAGSTAGIENDNDGGAIYTSVYEGQGNNVLITDIFFSQNYAGNWGGALCLRSGGAVTGCSFSKNIAAKFFGDAIMGHGLKIENCKFYDKEGKYTDLGDSNLIDTCAREGIIVANEINECTIENADLPSKMTGTAVASGNIWILLGVLIAAIIVAALIIITNRKKKTGNIFYK